MWWKPLLHITNKLTQRLKKKKEIAPKSVVWQYFKRIKDDKGVVVKGKCLYCATIYNYHLKMHGISSLKNYIMHCMKIPQTTKQSLLTLNPALNMVEAYDV